jgi:hypothetical protein
LQEAPAALFARAKLPSRDDSQHPFWVHAPFPKRTAVAVRFTLSERGFLYDPVTEFAVFPPQM